MSVVRIVEDTWDIAYWLALTLRLQGHTVIEPPETGPDRGLFHPEAWAGVDVAIVDLHLGAALTGKEVLTYLHTEHPHIRRVVFSAYPDLIADTAGLADVIVRKPASVGQILAAVGD